MPTGLLANSPDNDSTTIDTNIEDIQSRDATFAASRSGSINWFDDSWDNY